MKPSKSISKIANGDSIRSLRCRLGLTQLELAIAIDCSERLIRKIEKSESVSSKSLSLLCTFFKHQGLKISLSDLLFVQVDILSVGKGWFVGRFVDGVETADQDWFSPGLSLSRETFSKLEMLQNLAVASRVSLGAVAVFEQTVAISFLVDKRGGVEVDAPSGCVWLTIMGGKIEQLKVILDLDFDWNAEG